MKIIAFLLMSIALLCVSNAYSVENRDVQGFFYKTARVNEAHKEKLSSIVDDYLAKARLHDMPDPLYQFSKNECGEYFIDPIGTKYAVFSDSKYRGTYTINGYGASFRSDSYAAHVLHMASKDSNYVIEGYGEYQYDIVSDFKRERGYSDPINLFNIDFDAIPQQAKVREIDNTSTFNIYISSTGTGGRSNKIEKVYGIDIDKNGHEDFVILSSFWDNPYGYESEMRELTIVMNIASKRTISKLGTTSFPFIGGCNYISGISFVDYDVNQPVLISLEEAVAQSSYMGLVLYYYEQGKYNPLFYDFSY